MFHQPLLQISMAGFTPLNSNKTFTNDQLIALLSETPRVQPLGSANRYHHTAVGMYTSHTVSYDD